MEKGNKKLRSSLMLLLTAIIWGFAFVAQTVGSNAVGPMTFNGTRYIIGSAVLVPVIMMLQKNGTIKETPFTKEAVIGGICCGVCLFVAGSIQQYGLIRSTVGRGSFITALYVIIVPILGVFMKKKIGAKLWISVAIAIIGMYLLCINETMSLGLGEVLLLLCAFFFSIHIMVIDHFSPKANGVVISCIQFLVAGILSLIGTVLTENPTVDQLHQAGISILYAGIGSCGIAYTCQVVFQKDLSPTAASLILSLESVFGAIGGWLLLGQALSLKEIIGCLLMFGAIVLAQI